jgi:hypothetical protein
MFQMKPFLYRPVAIRFSARVLDDGQRPGSVRYDEPVSCVIFIKDEQFSVAALPLAGFKVPP